ncbi:MAG: hypothetical protein D6749_13025, partial [Chloroflexota bacterium]
MKRVSIKRLAHLNDILIFLIILLWLLASPVNISVPLDDVYVYFNYARNFAEGRPFAYDPRNIPSEGFTSLLYMLLLVPAELLDLNTFFVTVIINMLSLALSVVWIGRALRATGVLPKGGDVFFTIVLAALVVRDPNISALVYSGFEAVFGLLWVTGMAVSVAYALDAQRAENVRRRWLTIFFVMVFLAHLVRPEYVLIGAVGGVLLLWRFEDRAAVLRRAVIFALVMAGYYLLKLAIFGDLFPTGFYRKVRVSEIGQLLSEWIMAYQGWLILALLASLMLSVRTLRRFPLKRLGWLLMLVLGAVGVFVFYTQSTPLTPSFFRFLVMPIWTIYMVLALGAVWLLFLLLQLVLSPHQVLRLIKVAHSLVMPSAITMLILLVSLFISSNMQNNISSISNQIKHHHYINAALYWRSQLPDPSRITVVFGDAGAVAYTLGSRFIDPNGLAEPPIAHLFRLPDGEEKIARFLKHVLGNQPDIL